jgi:hypothetical protein
MVEICEFWYHSITRLQPTSTTTSSYWRRSASARTKSRRLSAITQNRNKKRIRCGNVLHTNGREAPLYNPARPSSALSGSLREKRLELRYNLGAVAVRALNALLFVLTHRHRKGETLATLLAKIFVERHINPRYYWTLFGFVSSIL